MSVSGEKRRRKIRRMYADQKGRCHWCGCHMLLIFRDWQNRRPPDRLATLEHIYSRWHPLYEQIRLRAMPGRHVLACLDCNNKRGILEQQVAISIGAIASANDSPALLNSQEKRAYA